MPGDARQAVRPAILWDASVKGGGVTICQPSLCPLHHPGQGWAQKPASPSAHQNPCDNRTRPYYSSRLAGGYLLLRQPAQSLEDKWRGGGGRLTESEKVYKQVRENQELRHTGCFDVVIDVSMISTAPQQQGTEDHISPLFECKAHRGLGLCNLLKFLFNTMVPSSNYKKKTIKMK